MADEDAPRPGTYADLARRMDRMEQKHEDLAKDVAALTATSLQVVANQNHSEELNKLRFDGLTTGVGQIGTKLDTFMTRIEGIMSGEVETAAGRQGRELVSDFQKWRQTVDAQLDEQDIRNGKEDLVARVVWGLVGGNIVAIIGFVVWLAAGGHIVL